MFIEATNISFSYENCKVFENFNFYARKGDSVSIMGPKNSGKSTLLKLLSGQLIANDGYIKVGNTSAELYKKAVLLPKNYQLNQNKTLLENLQLPLFLRGYSLKDAHLVALEQLNNFGLKHFCDYFPCQLNKSIIGQAALAETLLFDADLLLLDQPFENINADCLKQIYNQIYAKRLDGATLILVTNSETEAEIMTERSCCLTDNNNFFQNTNDYSIILR